MWALRMGHTERRSREGVSARKYVCHAVESENCSETALAFYVPPSAVSVSIKKLKTELGVPLFTRTGNRIRLGWRKAPRGIDFFREQYPEVGVIQSRFGPDRGL